MKIIALEAENVKKLVAIEIKPNGNLVQITGKNGQGKTSVLDSIWWALDGAANIQGTPIRKGEDKARIRLDMGEIVVTRTFEKMENGNVTTKISIVNADGTIIRQPQTMLDKLLGELSFDPLAFARMTKKEQFDALRKFVPEFDFVANEKAWQTLYDERTNINRQVHEAKILADNIFVTFAENDRPVDEMVLVKELEDAGKHNADIETRKANRERLASEAKQKGFRSINLRERAADLLRQAQEAAAEADKLDSECAVIDKKLDAAPPLPAPINVTAIRESIVAAKGTNAKFAQQKRKQEHLDVMAELEGQSDVITGQMNALVQQKEDAIAAAKLPVPGLGFGDGEILMNTVPFNQASDAEQLQVSIAIAMALNPKLRVIRVRDGSLLDEDSLAMLGRMAEDKDYQVWVERVGANDKVGFVIEDGHIKTKETVNA